MNEQSIIRSAELGGNPIDKQSFGLKRLTQEPLDNWHEVDWKSVNYSIANLRARMFACKRRALSKDGKVVKIAKRQLRRLQVLMLNSKHNILQSIRKVT